MSYVAISAYIFAYMFAYIRGVKPVKMAKNEKALTIVSALKLERKTGLKPATPSLEG